MVAEYERRFSPRYPFDAKAKMTRLDTEPAPAKTADISTGGLRLLTGSAASIGETIVVQTQLPDKNISYSFSARCNVTTVKQNPTTGQYELGLQFISLRDSDRTHLARFIGHYRKQVNEIH